ncbi:MAG: tyrosine-type recombinase/integrase [Pseudomonadota bacterium]
MNIDTLWSGWNLDEPCKTDPAAGGDEQRALQRQRKTFNNKWKVMEHVFRVEPGLFYGKRDIMLPDSTIDSFVDWISREFTGLSQKEAHNFLAKGLSNGCRKLGWRVSVPARLMNRENETNHATPASYQGLKKLDELIDAHETHGLTTSEDDQPAEWFLGRVIFSLITEGGLLNTHWLSRLIDAIQHGVGIYEGRVFLTLTDVSNNASKKNTYNALTINNDQGIRREKRGHKAFRILFLWPITTIPSGVGIYQRSFFLKLATVNSDGARKKINRGLTLKKGKSIEDEKPDHKRFRRLFLSPMTTLLLLHYLRKVGREYSPTKNEITCLSGYVGSLTSDLKLSKEKLVTYLIEASTTSAIHALPSYLVNYSRSSDSSISLDPDTWHRLTTGCVRQPLRQRARYDVLAEPIIPSSLNQHALRTGSSDVDQFSKFLEINTILDFKKGAGNTQRKIIKDNLRIFLSASHHNSPIIQAIALWALHLLVDGSVLKRKIAISTVKAYIGGSGINGRYLTSLASCHEDLSGLTRAQWNDIYNALLSKSKNDANRRSKSWALNQFHLFLQQYFDDIPDVEFESITHQPSRVDNNIITPAEYIRALDIIQDSDQPARFRTMQKLALMLGYRCGFRRSEIQHITTGDIHRHFKYAETNIETLIRDGKTESATRRFPIEQFVLPYEKNKIIQWLAVREGESISANHLLELVFCQPGQWQRPLNDTELFSPITKAIRAASGDPNVRFHHLRHACITLTHVRLDDATSDTKFPQQWAQDDEGGMVMPHWQCDLSQLLDLAPCEQTTRTRLWAMSGWFGHISPAESLQSYAHLTDWILGSWLWGTDETELTLSQQAALLGIKRASLPVWRSRHHLKGPTTAEQLVSTLGSTVFSPFLALPSKKKWRRYKPPERADISTPLVKLLNPLLVYQVLASVQKDQLHGKPLQQARTAVAQRFQLSETVVSEWVAKGEELMTLTTERKNGRQRYGNVRRRHPEPLSAEQLIESYLPELDRCLAPSRSPKQQRESHRYFQYIIDWYIEAPKDCLASLNVFHDAAQRSVGQVNFRDKSHLGPAIELYRKLHLMPHTSLHVEVERDADSIAAQQYWCRLHNLNPSQVHCSPRIGVQPTRNAYGLANLRLFYTNASSQKLHTPWPSLRFAIFTASLVIDSSLMSEVIVDRNSRDSVEERPADQDTLS